MNDDPPSDAAHRDARSTSMRALALAQHALAAPTPRRQRTWLHRVVQAVDALASALDEQIRTDRETLSLLSEIALTHPDRAAEIEELRRIQAELRVAVASLREHLELGPRTDGEIEDVRARFAALAVRYLDHRSREARLVQDATGRELDDA